LSASIVRWGLTGATASEVGRAAPWELLAESSLTPRPRQKYGAEAEGTGGEEISRSLSPPTCPLSPSIVFHWLKPHGS